MSLVIQRRFELWKVLLIMSLLDDIAALANIPLDASWVQNATTVAGQANGTIGSAIGYLYYPRGISITSDNTLYIADRANNRVVYVQLGSNDTEHAFGSFGSAANQFNYNPDVIATNTSVYVLDTFNYRVQKYSRTGTNPVTMPGAGTFTASFNMFVDKDETLYLSLLDDHKVICFAPNSPSYTVVAGNGTAGSSDSQLYNPNGPFVVDAKIIYITDTGNHRIQKWIYGASFGSTVAGTTGVSGSGATQLSYPESIAVDNNGHVYIADRGNNRIVRWPPNAAAGICIVACSGIADSQANTLNYPIHLTFDSTGSLYVADDTNCRIQKFQIIYNISPTTVASTAMDTTSEVLLTTSQARYTSTDNHQLISTATTTSMIIEGTDCSRTIISLFPYNPTIAEPLEVQRGVDFTISSRLNFACSKSLATIEQWTINACSTPICSVQEQLQLPSMTLGELYIPARTLDYGIYQMNLTVRMVVTSEVISSAVTYVKIVSSPITVNLLPFNVAMITRGQQQTLILDPSAFSIDPNKDNFSPNSWNYTYFCRIYAIGNNRIVNGSLLPVDDASNSSCFPYQTGNQTLWQYGSNQSRSLLIIFPGTLLFDRTYLFTANLTNIRIPTMMGTGEMLVRIRENASALIGIKCIIVGTCVPYGEYQLINPTTQIALTSFCVDSCSTSSSKSFITWQIFYGLMNVTNQMIQWTPFVNISQYANIWFFGMNTSNFTATKDLISNNPSIAYWQFQVIYDTGSTLSSSSISFIVNSSPVNGTCSISPQNGTTSTVFDISCSNWFDPNGIKDYSFYTWINDRSTLVMIGYTVSTTFQARMPIGDPNSTLLQVIVHVRDVYGCMIEWDMHPISVVADTPSINDLFSIIQTTFDNIVNSTQVASNPSVQILYGGNQNDVCQWLISLSRILILMANNDLQTAVISNGILATSISVSSLDQSSRIFTNQSFSSINSSTFIEQLNNLANIRDYLMIFINNLTIVGIDSIILQATTLAQLTATTNQLTHFALTIASTRCNQLAHALFNISYTTIYEDMQSAASEILQCASNTLTGANIFLQERGSVFDGVFSLSKTIQNNQTIYYQQLLARLIQTQYEQTKSVTTQALNTHLNINQSLTINSSSIIILLQRTTSNTIVNKTVQLNDNTRLKFPSTIISNISEDSSVLLQCVLTPLAIAGQDTQANTNLSTLLSVSILDENANAIPVYASVNQPIELLIPKDINTLAPTMILQNVSLLSINSTINNPQFNLHSIDIYQTTSNISVSVHFEMRPLNISLGYLLIYKFDGIPQLNSSVSQIDGWALECPSNLTNDSLWTYLIVNQDTIKYRQVIFGVRELSSQELTTYCPNGSASPPMTNQPFHFSANYEIRMFTSGCYYLDSNGNWQSDGLTVGSLTNYKQTQCLSTHLTTFAGGFVVLPSPINWNYVFANADFIQNKTIYLALIFVVLMNIILFFYARNQDKQDRKKFVVTYLRDNRPIDTYLYQLVIFTGVRKNAGTKSNVYFTLFGRDDETHVHSLSDVPLHVLQRASVDSFIVAAHRSLGPLTSMRIWHDNSGENELASWFLKYVIVRDLQTMEKSYFICQKWLAGNDGESLVHRVLHLASEEEKRQLTFILAKKTYHSIADGHLWLSVFLRPPSSRFTRVQRCTCCFVLLYVAMLINILYYNQAKVAGEGTSSNGLAIGPFYVASEQIGIGIIVDILISIPTTLLVGFFRRIRPPRSRHQISSVFQTQLLPSSAPQTRETNKRKRPRLLPWWCVFIAYGISLILATISIFFIITRGIQFGDLECQKWLTSLVSGFLSSILVSQPIKIVCRFVFLSLWNRHTDHDEEAATYIEEAEDAYLNDGQEHS